MDKGSSIIIDLELKEKKYILVLKTNDLLKLFVMRLCSSMEWKIIGYTSHNQSQQFTCRSHIYKNRTWARFTNNVLFTTQIRWRLRVAFIRSLVTRAQQNSAHATTAQLSWKFCTDHCVKFRMTVKWIFITSGLWWKMLVKWSLGHQCAFQCLST